MEIRLQPRPASHQACPARSSPSPHPNPGAPASPSPRSNPRSSSIPWNPPRPPASATSPTAAPASAASATARASATLDARRHRRCATRKPSPASSPSSSRPPGPTSGSAPLANGHLQATGRDARGRKQSRYHPRWREVRDETKYERMTLFGAGPARHPRARRPRPRPARPAPRQGPRHHRPPDGNHPHPRRQRRVRPRKQVLRPHHHAQQARRGRRLAPSPSTSKARAASTTPSTSRTAASPASSSAATTCPATSSSSTSTTKATPTPSTPPTSTTTSARSPASTSPPRTSAPGPAPSSPAILLREFEPYDSETQAKKNVVQAIKTVAARLGNTPSVCRKCYVHPAVLETYLAGKPPSQAVRRELEEEIEGQATAALREEELRLLELLQQRVEQAKAS